VEKDREGQQNSVKVRQARISDNCAKRSGPGRVRRCEREKKKKIERGKRKNENHSGRPDTARWQRARSVSRGGRTCQQLRDAPGLRVTSLPFFAQCFWIVTATSAASSLDQTISVTSPDSLSLSLSLSLPGKKARRGFGPRRSHLGCEGRLGLVYLSGLVAPGHVPRHSFWMCEKEHYQAYLR
jgi:hypothetical protein